VPWIEKETLVRERDLGGVVLPWCCCISYDL